ncbi:MAG: hypothetical protein K9I95_07905 [Flavobacteriaceae bacterium]|nr:hypothetical protein [Flavobacteriaceae bacterium]
MLFFSCYYDEFPEEVAVVIPENQVVSFADDIAPIFVTYNCTECHNATGQSPNLTASSQYTSLVPSYVIAGNSNSSDLYTMLAINDHRNVDAESLALIKKWIDDGAENN